ncbi:MAG: glycosyltransferase family 4 protein [Symploca sp. SIO2E9]|nr:glycosyltransferase family 4 protein [Symploca sp. SIO2E9]
MAKSPQLRQAMSRAVHQRVLDHFDWEVKVETMLGIYHEAINRYVAEGTQFSMR